LSRRIRRRTTVPRQTGSDVQDRGAFRKCQRERGGKGGPAVGGMDKACGRGGGEIRERDTDAGGGGMEEKKSWHTWARWRTKRGLTEMDSKERERREAEGCTGGIGRRINGREWGTMTTEGESRREVDFSGK